MDVEEFMKKQSMMAVKISSLLIFAVLVGCDAANNAEEAVKRSLINWHKSGIWPAIQR